MRKILKKITSALGEERPTTRKRTIKKAKVPVKHRKLFHIVPA